LLNIFDAEDESDTLSISEVVEMEDSTPTEEVKITEDAPDVLVNQNSQVTQ
jgi:hypothetical protein